MWHEIILCVRSEPLVIEPLACGHLCHLLEWLNKRSAQVSLSGAYTALYVKQEKGRGFPFLFTAQTECNACFNLLAR